jgi:hypothetical protein
MVICHYQYDVSLRNRFFHLYVTETTVSEANIILIMTNKIVKSHYPKRQRTVRRTYKLGKSKNKPIVGVLISNKTMRANVTTKKQLLNQTNIDEVKRYLIKNGFIRVGTSAPNDVLRKMHETAMMMCGEIQNHNPDNLLYNFLNST